MFTIKCKYKTFVCRSLVDRRSALVEGRRDVLGGALPQPVTVQTNAFGYYSFEGIPAGETYVLTVSSKRYVFAQPSLVLNVSDAVTDADFVSVE